MTKEILTQEVLKFYEKVDKNLAKIEDWQRLLGIPVPKDEVKVMDGYQYVTIDYAQDVADLIFKGNWTVEVCSYSTAFNAITVHTALYYNHPILNKVLRVDGVGAENIQLDRGAKLTEFEKMKQNAVVLALPIAKSTAVKNSLKTLGNIFGRSLKSPDRFDFVGVAATMAAETEKLLNKIKNTDVIETLKTLSNSEKYAENVRLAANERLIELTKIKE